MRVAKSVKAFCNSSEISSLEINVKELKNEKNKNESDRLNSQVKKLEKSVAYHSKKSKDLANKIDVEKETFKNSIKSSQIQELRILIVLKSWDSYTYVLSVFLWGKIFIRAQNFLTR